jgi:hypothetical protein
MRDPCPLRIRSSLPAALCELGLDTVLAQVGAHMHVKFGQVVPIARSAIASGYPKSGSDKGVSASSRVSDQKRQSEITITAGVRRPKFSTVSASSFARRAWVDRGARRQHCSAPLAASKDGEERGKRPAISVEMTMHRNSASRVLAPRELAEFRLVRHSASCFCVSAFLRIASFHDKSDGCAMHWQSRWKLI